MNDRPVSSTEALQRLRDGNERYVAELQSLASAPTAARRAALASGQSPFAVVLSCSDSRVPSEIVFDQGLGSLFVVRVAGNVVAPSLVGSVEFAVQAFGAELVVVMGHTACGAVIATLDALGQPGAVASENVLDIVERIRPAVAPLAEACSERSGELLARATRANVVASANQLRHGSKLLEERVAAGRLAVVGAEYALASGVVDFFDVPEELRQGAKKPAFGPGATRP